MVVSDLSKEIICSTSLLKEQTMRIPAKSVIFSSIESNVNGWFSLCNFKPIDLRPYIESDEDLKKQLLILGDYLDSRGNDYIGKRLHRNDYNFRWNHPEKNAD